jgi:5-methylcytosine-specific restriction endonuclease McrA
VRLSNPFAAPPRMKPKKVKRDTDAERAEKNYVRARDNGCVARRAAAFFANSAPPLMPCDGALDVDHVRASGGLGLKSPTHRTNMVVLCRHHHRAKTEYGKVWRPLLLAYLERVER